MFIRFSREAEHLPRNRLGGASVHCFRDAATHGPLRWYVNFEKPTSAAPASDPSWPLPTLPPGADEAATSAIPYRL
ncbi:hypothetical protein [Kitasatospora sp. NPDC017646]|uniref:hypothetical protein n=1 Tax=Kitasatospora sp. NPDC017646 TaxID=3364024 RepID=UPI0037A1C1C6